MNLSVSIMTELAMFFGQDNFFSLTIYALISFNVVLITLGVGWICRKNTLEKEKHQSFIDGYVRCMVDTYFYGYLKKIIPEPEIIADHSANHGNIIGGGLANKIMLYKEKNNLSDDDFPLHKIFILICASGYIPPNLESIDKDRIEARKNLEPLILNRAGTNGRIYSTAVYKIKKLHNLREHITVAMEGAPPLVTLSDSCKEDYELRKEKRKIIKMFCNKLSQKLKENEEFANSYEIIYYEDEPGKPATLAEKIIHIHIDKDMP